MDCDIDEMRIFVQFARSILWIYHANEALDVAE